MDRGAWWAAVHGISKSQIQLSDVTFTFHFHALEKEMTTHSNVLAWRIPGMGDWVHPWSFPGKSTNAVLGCILCKNDRMTLVRFWSKPLNIIVIQVYVQPLMQKKLTDIMKTSRLSTTNPKKKKKCPFYHRRLECKSRKLRDTWSNRQIWPWSTKWSWAKTNRVLPRECTGQSKHPLPTTQEMILHLDITRWLILKPDWLYSL